MDINEYIKSRIKQNSKTQENTSAEQAYAKYAGMGEEQLLSELFHKAGEARANGTLNAQTLNNFFAQVSPYLTPEQSEKMRRLIKELQK